MHSKFAGAMQRRMATALGALFLLIIDCYSKAVNALFAKAEFRIGTLVQSVQPRGNNPLSVITKIAHNI
jgi:hypothetical protein